mgnify:CR=1 FL=1
MKFNKTLLLTLFALPITACATNDGLLSNYGSNRPAWLNKLQQLNHTSDGKFRIIQVGDSHTAGDYFTDRLRRRLQQQWGNGGIGWVYPNAVKGQRMATVRYNGSGWNTISSRKSHSDFSFGGIEARADGGSVTLSAADGSMDMQQISIFGKPVWSEQTLTVNGREIPATQNGWREDPPAGPNATRTAFKGTNEGGMTLFVSTTIIRCEQHPETNLALTIAFG